MVNQNPDLKQSCLRCGKKALITDTETGEIFCGDCGFVLSERTENSGPEWRSFSDGGTIRSLMTKHSNIKIKLFNFC